MSILSRPYFYDEAKAFEHVEAVLWPQGPVCHHCGSMEKPYKLAGVRSKASKKNPEGVERHGLYKCKDCRGQFTVRMGTIFEESHIPLHKWLQAIHLMCASKKGYSAHQMHRTLEITYKSAWFLCHRIREAMRDSTRGPLGGLGKVVEADETYFGNGSRKARSKIGRRAGPDKWKVLALVERNGKARSVHMDYITANEVRLALVTNIDRKSDLMTDESNVYRAVGREFASHDTVNHSAYEYGRGAVSTNTVEGFFSIFKRGMKGIYQHCGERHLHRYLAEFDFRYNHRVALGINDDSRAISAIGNIVGKRLYYRQPE